VDIDTLKDARMISATLDLFEEYGIKASFFVATGMDETYRNFRHYTPWKLISGNNLKRYGFYLFSGLLTKKDVQKSNEINMITEQGHELGLHGYSHYNWMNHLDTMSKEELSCWISNGCELFEKAFGFHPECFAAPGFKTNMNYLEILDDFGFKYSSDFMGEKPFYPFHKNIIRKTLQIPVSLAIGEYEDEEAIRRLKEQITAGYAVFYFHPSNEPIFRKDLMDEALSLVADRAVPLGELI
jgi:undecaprenyl phosphate-alpha-L-ara4FN deformylase